MTEAKTKTRTKRKPRSARKKPAPHLIIEARAGTGKTTTLIEGLRVITGKKPRIKPSEQQSRIWDAMRQGPKPKTVCFVAFNKSIATELQRRVPAGCSASTLHSLGLQIIRQSYPRIRVNGSRTVNLLAEHLGYTPRELRRDPFWGSMVSPISQLVRLAKLNLIDPDPTALYELALRYGIEADERVCSTAARILERARSLDDNEVDFDDMVWLGGELPTSTMFDLLLVDEAQDLNPAQQRLVQRVGRRLILCGDPCQAIYGFAGADTESMTRMESALSQTEVGVEHLHLTVTRRCGRAIVEEAKPYVPQFEAHPDNPEGRVSFTQLTGPQGSTVLDLAEPGDMVLSRVNAPLVSLCFRFIKAGRKASIQGRDIGQNLTSTINRLCKPDDTVVRLLDRLAEWLDREVSKERAKAGGRYNPEARIAALQDRHDCIVAFTDEAKTVREVLAKIEQVFTDDEDRPDIRLSSIHKAKGLEADRVFVLRNRHAPLPHPMAKLAWEKEQERNLTYVAITRAIQTLVWVGD